jgi:hypothetical protein
MAGVDPIEAQKKLDRANLLTGVTGALGVVGSLVTGYSAYKTALARAAVYSANAANIRATVPLVQRAGSLEVDALQQETGQLLSAQRAAMAANGIVVDMDTGLDAAVQAAGVGARDAVLALQNTQNEILKLRNQANQAEFEAAMAKREGKGSVIEAVGKAGMTILGTASTIADRNKQFKLGKV